MRPDTEGRRRSAWEQISGRYACQFHSDEAIVVE